MDGMDGMNSIPTQWPLYNELVANPIAAKTGYAPNGFLPNAASCAEGSGQFLAHI